MASAIYGDLRIASCRCRALERKIERAFVGLGGRRARLLPLEGLGSGCDGGCNYKGSAEHHRAKPVGVKTPRSLVSQDRIEQDCKLTSNRDQGDHFCLASTNKPLVKALHLRVVPHRHQCRRKRALRAAGRPPPIKLLPFERPDWRVKGAQPTIDPASRAPSALSSGTTASRVADFIPIFV